MKIDISKRTLYLRSSETSSWVRCLRQAALVEPKDLEEDDDEYSGTAAGLGTRTHLVIRNILKEAPYIMDEDVSSIIGVPCKFDGYIPYKKVTTIVPEFPPVCETEQEKIKWLKHQYNATKVYTQEGEYKLVVNTDTFDDTGILSISDIIHPAMFGSSPLVRIEYPLSWEFQYEGWKIVFTGTLDAATNDYDLIVDWKTSSKTPTLGSHEFDYYKMQQCIYKLLANLSIGDEHREGIAVLAFLVKTKIPKFFPLCFEIKKEHLVETKKFIMECAKAIIEFVEGKRIPIQSITGSCNYCKVFEKCFTMNPRIPTETITCQRVICR